MLSLTLIATVAIAVQGYGSGQPAPAPPAPRPQSQSEQPQQRPAPLPQLVVPTSPPGKSLRDLQAITVRYYDVPGKKLKDVIKALTEQRPKDANGQPVTAATNWSIKTEFSKRTDGKGGCQIAGAKAVMGGTVDLPRLADDKSFAKRDRNAWDAYIGTLETSTAAKLWYVRDHTVDVEKAILGATCDNVQSVSAAAIEKLRADANAIQAPAAVAAAPATTN